MAQTQKRDGSNAKPDRLASQPGDAMAATPVGAKETSPKAAGEPGSSTASSKRRAPWRRSASVNPRRPSSAWRSAPPGGGRGGGGQSSAGLDRRADRCGSRCCREGVAHCGEGGHLGSGQLRRSDDRGRPQPAKASRSAKGTRRQGPPDRPAAEGIPPRPVGQPPTVRTSCGRWDAVPNSRERRSTPSDDVVASTKLTVPLPLTAAVTSYSTQLLVAIDPRSARAAPLLAGRLAQVNPVSVQLLVAVR